MHSCRTWCTKTSGPGAETNILVQMQRLCADCGEAERPNLQRALIRTLLQWAHQHRAWQQVTALPFTVAEEQVRDSLFTDFVGALQ